MKETLTERPPKVVVSKGARMWYITVYLHVTEVDGGFECEPFTTEVDHRPALGDVRDAIIAHIDAETDEKILTGYQWTVLHGEHAGQTVYVWLSKENQDNFKAKHDAAIIYPDRVTFPFSYKISEDADHKAIYETFQNIGELATFYLGGLAYIDQCYGAGWVEKDAVDEWLEDVVL